MRMLLAGAALALSASGAFAADIIEPAAFDWTGFYVGAQAGYGWGDNDFRYKPDDGEVEMEYEGFVGGVTAGLNWQVDSLVLGVEGDVSYSDFSDDVLLPQVPENTPCLEEGCSLDIDWFSTIRLRLGYAADTVMPFISGGLAFGSVEATFDEGACECDIDDVAFGWTIGGGIEWAFAERWSAKAEYLYVDLGKPDTEGNSDITNDVSTSSFDFSVVRAGVNYRF